MRFAAKHTSRSERIRMIMRRAGKHSFTLVEDNAHSDRKIRMIAASAVRKAAEENRKLGLAAIVVRRNQVIKIDAQKKEQIIATLKEGDKKYKPGQVLYARKG